MKKKVTVEYIWQGKSFEAETESGVLLSHDRVLVFGGGIAIYECKQTDKPDTCIVDLDKNDEDYHKEYFKGSKSDFLVDLIVG